MIKFTYSKNNGAANTEEIVDADDYNLIFDCCMELHLFQEGKLAFKIRRDGIRTRNRKRETTDHAKVCFIIWKHRESSSSEFGVARDLKDLTKYD